MYLSVDADGFSTSKTFTADVYETDGVLGKAVVSGASNISLTYNSSLGRWRGEWTTKWIDDGAPTYDPDYIFIHFS